MDLNQIKLSKSEWESIEVPVSTSEQQVLKLIMNGYHNVNIRTNMHHSMFSYLKIEYNEDMEDYLYNKYFSETINEIVKKYSIDFIHIQVNSNPLVKKIDIIRVQQNTESSLKKIGIYEYVLIETIEKRFYQYSNLMKYFELENFSYGELNIYEKLISEGRIETMLELVYSDEKDNDDIFKLIYRQPLRRN
jgi:arsenate reductase-like glutaredoxin family protein